MQQLRTHEEQAIDFLSLTNTGIELSFLGFKKHFAEDIEPRNVWRVTLLNNKHEFTFYFGDSISNSTTQIKKRQDECSERIDVYAGLRFTQSTISVGVSFQVKKENDFSLPPEEIEKMAMDMELDYLSKVSAKNKIWTKKFKAGSISRNKMISEIEGTPKIGAFIQCIQKAIKREREKLVPFNIQSGEKRTPSSYDVLSCLTKADPGTFEDFCGDFGYCTDSKKAEKTYLAVKDEFLNISRLFTDVEIENLQKIN